MKQLIKTQLPVFLEGITDYWSELGRIEVVFAQSKNGVPVWHITTANTPLTYYVKYLTKVPQ